MDCKRIAEIQVEGWRAAYRGIIPDDYLAGLSPKARMPVWERFIREEHGKMFVIEPRLSGVAGFCHLIPSRDSDANNTAEIAAIYVDPTQWRKGYGRQLYTGARGSAMHDGFIDLTLWVLEENTTGRHFYEAVGFQTDGARKSEARPGFTVEEIRYRTRLKARDPNDDTNNHRPEPSSSPRSASPSSSKR